MTNISNMRTGGRPTYSSKFIWLCRTRFNKTEVYHIVDPRPKYGAMLCNQRHRYGAVPLNGYIKYTGEEKICKKCLSYLINNLDYRKVY